MNTQETTDLLAGRAAAAEHCYLLGSLWVAGIIGNGVYLTVKWVNTMIAGDAGIPHTLVTGLFLMQHGNFWAHIVYGVAIRLT